MKGYNEYIKNFENIVPPATSVENGMVSIPYVYTRENNEYHGFVPGFHIKDVIYKNLNDCKKALKLYIKEEILKRIENNQPFPFFPTDEEIKRDFDNVVEIVRENFEIPSI